MDDKLVFSTAWAKVETFGKYIKSLTDLAPNTDTVIGTYVGLVPVFIVQVNPTSVGRWYLPGVNLTPSNTPFTIKAWANSGNIYAWSELAGTAKLSTLQDTL